MNRCVTGIRDVALVAVIAVGAAMTAFAAGNGGVTGMAGSAYYKVHPMFHPFPDEKAQLQSIDRFGPVGIGIELLQPAFAKQRQWPCEYAAVVQGFSAPLLLHQQLLPLLLAQRFLC